MIKDLPSDPVIASRMRVIQGNKPFQGRVGDAIASWYPEKPPSPLIEKRIYDHFLTTGDRHFTAMFHKAPWEARRPIVDKMADDRLREIGLRLLAFEANHLLSLDEREQFNSWLALRREGPSRGHSFRTIEQATSECFRDLECASGDENIRLKEILEWLQSMRDIPIVGPPNETQSPSRESGLPALGERTG